MRPSVSAVWTAKRLSAVLMTAAFVVLLAGVVVSAEGDPYVGDHTGDALVWQHASRITMNESITPIGGGQYRYAFAFVNTEGGNPCAAMIARL